MNDKPELPPHFHCRNSGAFGPLYTADQMHAFRAEGVAAAVERCAHDCDTAAQEYDACAASQFATEHGREWHRRAAEWARNMAAALRANKSDAIRATLQPPPTPNPKEL